MLGLGGTARSARLRAIAPVVVAATLLVSACGNPTPVPGSASPVAAVSIGAPSASAAASPSPSPVPSDTASPSPSPSASASVSPSPSPSSSPSARPFIGTAPVPCPGTAGTGHGGTLSLGAYNETAGYVGRESSTPVKCVEGTWTEPWVTCSDSTFRSVNMSVGIDQVSASGGSSRTFAAVGASADCYNGQVDDYTWSIRIPTQRGWGNMHLPVSPGDRLWGKVLLLPGNKIHLAMVNLTQSIGVTDDSQAKPSGLLRASWMVSQTQYNCAKASTCKSAPIVRFGTITMDGFATVGSKRYPLRALPFPVYRLVMMRGSRLLATTSSIGRRGFTVTWKHS